MKQKQCARIRAFGLLAVVITLLCIGNWVPVRAAGADAGAVSAALFSSGDEDAPEDSENASGEDENASVADGAASMETISAETFTAMTDLIDGWPAMGAISEETGFLKDADNGAVLYSLNSSRTRYPASTTKILTALLVIENCDLDETVTMTSAGTQMVTAGSTNAQTVNGETFTVEQCLYMLLLKSANDIANQLAEHTAGSIDAFVDRMNKRAEALGCTGTHFSNPSGMPESEHYTTAEDMAIIMEECIKNETFLRIAGTESYTVPATNYSAERTYTNHNSLIVKGSDVYYEYCIAGKTGYTDAAWRTYVAAAKKDGRTLVVVLMRGPTKQDFQDAVNLFEYGFNQFQTINVTGGSVTIPTTVREEELTNEATEMSDGKLDVRFYYNGLAVGKAEMTASEYDAYGRKVEQLEADYEEEQSVQEDAGTGLVDIRALLIVFAAIFIVLIAGIAYSRAQSRKHRR